LSNKLIPRNIRTIAVGDGGGAKGRGALASPKIEEKYFSGKNHVTFGHFVYF